MYYYALVNKNGNFLITGRKLPIYWNRKIAIKEGIKFKAYSIRKIDIAELKTILKQI